MNLVNAIPIIISGPLFCTMAYRSMIKFLCPNMIVGIAFVTVAGSTITSVYRKVGFNLFLSRVSKYL